MESIKMVYPITGDHYDEVITHLRYSFFADEPLNKSLKLCEHGDRHDDLERHSLEALKDNLSIMAIDENTNKIVGVSLNAIQNVGDVEKAKEKLAEVKDPKYRNIFTFLYGIDQDLNLFQKYHVDRIFECRILSVDQKYRGQGLAKKMLQKSLEIAKAEGFQIFKQDATSFYTQKIAENLNFITVFELRYKAHRDEKGEPIFKTLEPHKFLKVMIKTVA